MSDALFDPALLPLRRARAGRMGRQPFLYERAFDDIVERILLTERRFESALIFGHSEPDWSLRLRNAGVDCVQAMDVPSSQPLPSLQDLCISIGALDSAEPLPAILTALRFALAPGALFIGAFAGGDSLPVLRSAMRAADEADGSVSAHVHPRIAPSSFATLLAEGGFVMPVVDVDRVRLRYASFDALIGDLRAMEATNRLSNRSRRPVLRRGLAAARAAFAALANEGRTAEMIEIIHFAAWTPTDGSEN
ncbi:MAG: hypothetical protein ABR588_04565 [Sphingomicrobium sp.]|nr:hypothetical protein [Sphingomonadales bacterium]